MFDETIMRHLYTQAIARAKRASQRFLRDTEKWLYGHQIKSFIYDLHELDKILIEIETYEEILQIPHGERFSLLEKRDGVA